MDSAEASGTSRRMRGALRLRNFIVICNVRMLFQLESKDVAPLSVLEERDDDGHGSSQ